MARRNAYSILFAVLDAVIVIRFGVRSLAQSSAYLAYRAEWPPVVSAIEAARAMLVVSLAASALLLACGGRWAARVNLAQLPLRFIFTLLGEGEYLTFGFFTALAPVLPPSTYSYYWLVGAAAVTEILRTVLQIILGRRAWRRRRAMPLPG